jgi:hypothetical protein
VRVHPLAVVTGLGLAWWLGGPVAGHFRDQAKAAEAEKAREEFYQREVRRCQDEWLATGRPSAWPAYAPGDAPGWPTGFDSMTWQCAGMVLRQMADR